MTFNCLYFLVQLDFWKAPHKVDLAVDVHVTEQAYKRLAVKLKERNIQFQIVIFDVEKLMDEEQAVQTRGLAFSFYSQYHPLDEVFKRVESANLLAV